jgi:DNA-binding winged helix-turn-helix (wHTH) protein
MVNPMLRFADFALDSEARTLVRAGEPVVLAGKAFQLLEILIAQRPKVLTKARLRELLWPDTFVTDASLHSLVAEIRTALGDSRQDPQFIRTVYGYGYAFCGHVDESPPTVTVVDRCVLFCSLLWGQREVPLRAGENVLGRDATASICLASNTVSRRHARILVSTDAAVIEDLASKNGTLVGGLPLNGPRPLSHGDDIRIGSVHLTFLMPTYGASTCGLATDPR